MLSFGRIWGRYHCSRATIRLVSATWLLILLLLTARITAGLVASLEGT
jgi:hypothetical protein